MSNVLSLQTMTMTDPTGPAWASLISYKCSDQN